MKLALIITGGTIGSCRNTDGWIRPNKEEPCMVLDLYRTCFPEKASNIQFVCRQPYQILSENLSGQYLMLLIDMVRECVQEKDIDGILICHGTDTLAYTAAVLNDVYADTDVPILLVSSNYPLEDVRANGLDNFYYAVETIQKGLKGVFAVYRNSDGKTYVHRGDKLLAHQTFEDDLYSMQKEYIGYFDTDGIWHDGSKVSDLCATKKISYRGLTDTSDGILWLRIYPGFNYPAWNEQTKAVLLESYHSGTIAINDSLRKFAETAKQKHIPVYLTGAVSDDTGYETVREYQSLGIQVLLNQAPIAAYCHMWLELSSLYRE